MKGRQFVTINRRLLFPAIGAVAAAIISFQGDVRAADDPLNIESDPKEEHNIGEMYNWVLGPLLTAVEEYKETLNKDPNPPAANMTRF